MSGGLTLTVTALAGMLLGCTVVGGVSQIAVGRARADAAADLTALAVAGRLSNAAPQASACAAGAAVAVAAKVRLDGCTVEGSDATVTVVATLSVLGLQGTVTSTARAGPVPP